MKKYLTTILLLSILLLSEAHTFWEHSATNIQNWILFRSVPMSLQWNIKMVAEQLVYIVIFTSMLFYQNNRINKTTVIVFIGYAVFDTTMYFINYKTYNYIYVYVALFMSWPIIYMMQRKRKPVDKTGYLYEQLNWE